MQQRVINNSCDDFHRKCNTIAFESHSVANVRNLLSLVDMSLHSRHVARFWLYTYTCLETNPFRGLSKFVFCNQNRMLLVARSEWVTK